MAPEETEEVYYISFGVWAVSATSHQDALKRAETRLEYGEIPVIDKVSQAD